METTVGLGFSAPGSGFSLSSVWWCELFEKVGFLAGLEKKQTFLKSVIRSILF